MVQIRRKPSRTAMGNGLWQYQGQYGIGTDMGQWAVASQTMELDAL